MSTIRPVRKAVLAYLDAQPDKPCPIEEAIKESTPKPYIVLGEKTEVPADAFARPGFSGTMTFSIYSTYSGDKELLEINEWLMEKLHRQKIVVSESLSVRMRSELMTTTRTVDLVRALVNRFRAIPLTS